MNNLNSINADFVSQGNQEEVFITCCISGACRWCYQNWKNKKKVATISLASNYLLVVELFLPDALLFPLIVPDNCILFSSQLMDECLLLVFEFLVSLCWKFIIIYQASVFVFLCVIIIALLLSSKPKTYKLHTGVPLSISTSIK